jgi:hypothetical protein
MWLENSFAYILVAATSVLFFLFGVKRLRLDPHLLRGALAEVTECIGASVVFLGINALTGLLVIFTIRALRFFPLYALSDLVLVFLSAFQGVLFQRWWRKSQIAPEGKEK